jgi:beta-glucosidase/6-phospho-beta-glucosidase/beta-galactosidase
MAGFESACHINSLGKRIDMIAAVQHDHRAEEDYRLLQTVAIRTCRDGIRWPFIDRPRGFDFSSFLPMLEAAHRAGTQVIWTLCHYGWPDGLDVFSPAFVERFARYAGACARVIREHGDEIPFYAPMNEISFLTWAASREIIYPYAHGRDVELKHQLVRAVIAGCESVWQVDPRARFIYPEPVINVLPPRERPELAAQAAAYTESQYEAWDMIAGRRNPELGGNERYLDIIGVNYYHSNQWELPSNRLRWEDEPRDDRWLPFSEILARTWKRCGRPIHVAETSHFGVGRARWIREIAREVHTAISKGVPVDGVCLYPILDRHDWEDENHWHNSGLWDLENVGGGLRRVLNPVYAEALGGSQALLRSIGCV